MLESSDSSIRSSSDLSSSSYAADQSRSPLEDIMSSAQSSQRRRNKSEHQINFYNNQFTFKVEDSKNDKNIMSKKL